MTTAGSEACQQQGCRRRVSLDNPFFPYCHDHRQLSEVYAAQGDDLSQLSRFAIPLRVTGTTCSMHRNMLAGTYPVSADDAGRILVSVADFGGDRDLSIPSQAFEVMEKASWSLRDQMEGHGIDPGRMTRMELVGMNRRTQSGNPQSSPEHVHSVLVLDQGTPRGLVVDPVVSAFAPVHDHSAPVEVELGSGRTPFADFPWIGTPEEYINGYHLWWDSSALQGW